MVTEQSVSLSTPSIANLCQISISYIDRYHKDYCEGKEMLKHFKLTILNTYHQIKEQSLTEHEYDYLLGKFHAYCEFVISFINLSVSQLINTNQKI